MSKACFRERLCRASFALALARGASIAFAQPVVEFYNSDLDHFFVTADPSEALGIDSGLAGPGWLRTGDSFNPGGDTPVCRFYGSVSPGPNSHVYTLQGSECEQLKQLQAATPSTQPRWNFEGWAFQSTAPVSGACGTGTVPVYRAFNNGPARGLDSNHRLSTHIAAIQQLAARGWTSEGIVMCAPASAAGWQKDPLPVNLIESVAVDPLDRRVVYAGQRNTNPAAGAEHAVWRSDDAGASFHVVATGVSFKLLPSPTDPNRVFGIAPAAGRYAAFANTRALYVSPDRGQTWQLAFPPGTGVLLSEMAAGYGLGQHPTAPNTIYASGLLNGQDASSRPYGAIEKSTDGGRTWSDVSPQGFKLGAGSGVFGFNPAQRDTVFLAADYTAPDGSSGVLLRSVDGGQSWQAADSGLIVVSPEGTNFHRLTRIVAVPSSQILIGLSDYGQMWINSDGGASRWRPLPLPANVSQFLWNAHNPNTLIALTRDRTIVRSDDLGNTWLRAATPGNAQFVTGDDSIPDAIAILLTTDSALFESLDGGQTWTPFPKPPIPIGGYATGAYGVNGIVTDQNHVVVAPYNGFGSMQVLEGATWQEPIGLAAFRSTLAVAQLAAFGDRVAANAQAALFQQDAQGAWSNALALQGVADAPRLSSDGRQRGIYGGRRYVIFGAYMYTLYSTGDGGDHWASDNSFPAATGDAVFDAASKRLWYLTSAPSVIRKEADGSSTLVSAGLPLAGSSAPLLANSQAAPATLYLDTAQGLYHSIDGGDSWNAVPAFNPGVRAAAISVDPTDALKVWVAAPAGLAYSVDGGTHWTQAAPENFASGVTAVATHPTHSGVVAAATSGGIWVTTDAGTNWHNVGGPGAGVAQILFVGDTLHLATAAGMFACANLCGAN